jgi:hypothetical protein
MIGTKTATRTSSVTDGKVITPLTLMTITPPSSAAQPVKEWPIDTNNVKVFVNGTRVKSPGVNYTLSDINQNDSVKLSGQPATEVYVTR